MPQPTRRQRELEHERIVRRYGLDGATDATARELLNVARALTLGRENKMAGAFYRAACHCEAHAPAPTPE